MSWERDLEYERIAHARMRKVNASGVANMPEEFFPKAYGNGDLRAFVGYEPLEHPHGDQRRWHISVQGPGRVPTWEEVRDAAHELRPGIIFGLAVVPRSWWINVNEFVLHLWEVKDEPLINSWRREGEHYKTLGIGRQQPT